MGTVYEDFLEAAKKMETASEGRSKLNEGDAYTDTLLEIKKSNVILGANIVKFVDELRNDYSGHYWFNDFVNISRELCETLALLEITHRSLNDVIGNLINRTIRTLYWLNVIRESEKANPGLCDKLRLEINSLLAMVSSLKELKGK